MEREGRPTLPFWKLSLGQSPHCHTLLASPGPSSSYARGHTGKAATLKVSSFMMRQAPSAAPHSSRGLSTQVRHSLPPCRDWLSSALSQLPLP